MAGVDKYCTQNITQIDIDAVSDCLRSENLTQGLEVEAFEHDLEAFLTEGESDTQELKVTVCSSGTSALTLLCAAAGVTSSSLVWVPAISFVATANAPKSLGARVEFVDCDPVSGQLDQASLLERLRRCSRENHPLPNFVIVVHMAGMVSDLERFAKELEFFNVTLLEDAAHSFGARYPCCGRIHSCGRCSKGMAFSFHAIKNIACGEGGAFCSFDDISLSHARLLRSHGVRKYERNGVVESDQELLGYNYRLTDIQCALGRSQLASYRLSLSHRRKLAERYLQGIAGLIDSGFLAPLPEYESIDTCAWHLFRVCLSGGGKNALMKVLRQHGVGFNINYKPINRTSYWVGEGADATLTGANQYYSSTLSLPMHTLLEVADVDYVCQVLVSFFYD